MTTDPAAQQSVEQAIPCNCSCNSMCGCECHQTNRIAAIDAMMKQRDTAWAESDDLAAALAETAQWFHHTQHNWTNAVESYRDCAVLPCQSNRALLARSEGDRG